MTASDAVQGGGPDDEEKRWTLLELLNWTTAHFRRAGVDSPRLNAELLLAEVTNLPRIMLYASFDREIGRKERSKFRDLVSRRAQRCPLQYLLGQWEFYGREFEVTPAVMIPRQETELLVDKCLEKIPGDGSGLSAADIGTGSGVIAVTLACERRGLRVMATDASPEALELARRNAERNGVADRVSFAPGRLCEPLSCGENRGAALVASNPPYVPSGRIQCLQPEVRDYEPRQALDGGPDGLSVIRDLIPQAADVLNPAGWLVLELGEDQAARVREMIAANDSLDADSVETTRDTGGCERVLAVRTKGNGSDGRLR